MLSKIKSFFIKIIPSKRKIIQLYAALLYNANLKGFVTGEIFTGDSKAACLPGLNCYSCPGAIGACPLGSLQNALSESKTKLPTYVLGIILLYSIILGRTICGFLCPFGLIQELLYKIKSPKLKKNKITRVLSYFKYVLLVVLVFILPLIYALQANNIPLPAFCKYICPAGTLEGAVFLLGNPNNTDFFGMLGALFTWKFALLVGFIVASVFIFRFFCRFFCPLGALYGLFNKLSILGVKVDKSKCNHCQACINNCKMDVKEVGDHECIQCGDCRKVCHCNAIEWKTIHKIIKDDLKEESLTEEASNESLTSNDNVSEYVEEKKNAKRSFKISSKLFNRIVGIIATIVLVIVLIAVNFKKEPFEINDICEELEITMLDSIEFNIQEDERTTLLYFYETLTTDNLETLKKYSNEKMNIILISSYKSEINEIIENNIIITNETINELSNLNIRFAYDTKRSETIMAFSGEKDYQYSVFMDFNDKILYKGNDLINETDFLAIIDPIISSDPNGPTIGNKVGDICFNKEIGLVGNEDKFSVMNNRGKIIVINFWYTSCTPCVQELPYFNKVYQEYSDSVTMIAIHEALMYQADPEDVKKFIDEQFTDFTILFGYDDPEESYYKMLGGKRAWPTTVIVDQEGIISFVKSGSLTEAELRAEIEKLLN